MTDQAYELRELVRREASQRSNGTQSQPRFVAVSGGRDGVGTTTLALTLAFTASQSGRRVLLVDADPKRGDVASLCRCDERYMLADVLAARRSVREAIQPGPTGIWVLPGGWAANRPTGDEHFTAAAFKSRVAEPLRTMGDRFDLVVLDAGNCTSGESAERRWWADTVVLVTTPHLPAIMDAYATIKNTWKNAMSTTAYCLVNMVDNENTATDVYARLERSCRRFLGLPLHQGGYLLHDVALTRSIAEAKTVFMLKERSPRTKQISLLIESLMSQGDVLSRAAG